MTTMWSRSPRAAGGIVVVKQFPIGRLSRPRCEFGVVRKLPPRDNPHFSAVPGIDAAFMAMDMDEGLEVIWNEVTYSESKDYRAQEKQMKASLDSMISITHPNIVKVQPFLISKLTLNSSSTTTGSRNPRKKQREPSRSK